MATSKKVVGTILELLDTRVSSGKEDWPMRANVEVGSGAVAGVFDAGKKARCVSCHECSSLSEKRH